MGVEQAELEAIGLALGGQAPLAVPLDPRGWEANVSASSTPGGRVARRSLEVVTGVVTWSLLTSPLWGALFVPRQLVWFLLLFNAYWLYKSANMAVSALIGYRRLLEGQKTDWLGACQELPGWRRIHHLVMIPTYREPPEVLEVMLDHLEEQDFPRDRVSVVLAFEERDPNARECATRLTSQFEGLFANLWVTFHPDRDGELPGKSSNLAYASRWAKSKLVDGLRVDLNDVVVTVCDADSRLHHKYLSALAHKFLTNPSRRYRIWQPALMFYSNVWRIPLVARISAGLYSVWQLSRLVASYKLVTQSTYSLGLATCDRVGYWDVDVIPEDSRMFFKVFFTLGHELEVQVEPIFLPVLADAAEGPTLWKTLANHYRQTRRWAWGVSDISYVLQRAARQRAVPLWARLRRVTFYAEEHVVWPTHWFLLVIGGGLIASFSPDSPDLATLERIGTLSTWLITGCLPSLAVVIWIDRSLRPARPTAAPWWHEAVGFLAWLLLPVVGLVLTALPALDAHTRLLLGRYLHYQVTEKLPADRSYVPRWAERRSSAEAA